MITFLLIVIVLILLFGADGFFVLVRGAIYLFLIGGGILLFLAWMIV